MSSGKRNCLLCGSPEMLKLDVQGFGPSALKARKALERVIAVKIEINFVSHHLKSCGLSEVYSSLESGSFERYRVPARYLGEERSFFAEAVYRRKVPRLSLNILSRELRVAE